LSEEGREGFGILERERERILILEVSREELQARMKCLGQNSLIYPLHESTKLTLSLKRTIYII